MYLVLQNMEQDSQIYIANLVYNIQKYKDNWSRTSLE